jgi:ubiquinone/menaquinone biosynthesis C-methylase UbiE
MADVYAMITDADPALVARIAEVLELRAADPQQQAMRRAYLADIAFPDRARVLEVGCGTGAVTRELAGWPQVAEVTGIDPSPTFLDRARALDPPANIRFVQGDARDLPVPDHAAEVVVFHTTLCHIPGPELALAEAARVLRPGGCPAWWRRPGSGSCRCAASATWRAPTPATCPRSSSAAPTPWPPPAGSSATSPTPAWSPGAPADPATPYWSAAGR